MHDAERPAVDDADPKWVAAIRQAATVLCPTPPMEDTPE